MNMQQNPVFTIGHSIHSIEAFLELLDRHHVAAVADVRSAPYSRFNPQFNRDMLEHSLRTHGIRYVFLGKELGARSEDPSCYEAGRVQYSRLARTELFRSGLERVIRGSQEYRLALMCAEKDPLECHRTLLVAQALVERGLSVCHILADGSLELHENSLTRLLESEDRSQDDLFRSREDRIADALARQERRIAYAVDKRPAEARGESA